MSNFKHNFSELLLLANKNIVFKDLSSDFSFELIPMKVEDIFFDESINMLISILDEDIENLKKRFGLNVDNFLMFLTQLCAMEKQIKNLRPVAEKVKKALQKLIPRTEFNGNVFKLGEYYLDPETFNEIISIIFKILGKEKIIINESDDEFTRLEKQARLRAQQIRRGGKKEGDGEKMEDMLLALLYEYPQYKLEDLFQLNIYTFNYLFSKVGQIANYEVSKIAAGNGLTKKHKYLIGKK